jgi:hypothetical protein
MDFEKSLITLLLFVFSAFLYPNMADAVQDVSISEPLQPLIFQLPLIWLVALLLIFVYTVINHE